jgi:hypothetical protein
VYEALHEPHGAARANKVNCSLLHMLGARGCACCSLAASVTVTTRSSLPCSSCEVSCILPHVHMHVPLKSPTARHILSKVARTPSTAAVRHRPLCCTATATWGQPDVWCGVQPAHTRHSHTVVCNTRPGPVSDLLYMPMVTTAVCQQQPLWSISTRHHCTTKLGQASLHAGHTCVLHKLTC